MKLLFASLPLLLLAPQLIHGQDDGSQPQCANWTKPIYFYNDPALQSADYDYLFAVITTIEADCFDADGVPTPCSLEIASDLPEAPAYETECYKGGGRIWTYTYHPLCGEGAGTADYSVKPVLICASASCSSSGVSNLIPQQELRELKNYSCGSGVNDLEMKDYPSSESASQPECYNWTQAQLFDWNPDLKPAEDAYLEMVALKMGAECLDTATSPATAKACDITLSEDDAATKKYKEECEKVGGVVTSYELKPNCNPGTPEMKIAPMIVCSSASCTENGVINLYPRQEETYKYMDEAGITCGSVIDSSNTEVLSSPTGSSGTNLQVFGSVVAATLLAISAFFV